MGAEDAEGRNVLNERSEDLLRRIRPVDDVLVCVDELVSRVDVAEHAGVEARRRHDAALVAELARDDELLGPSRSADEQRENHTDPDAPKTRRDHGTPHDELSKIVKAYGAGTTV